MEEGRCERSQAPDITQRLLAAKDGRGQIRIIPRSLLLIIPYTVIGFNSAKVQPFPQITMSHFWTLTYILLSNAHLGSLLNPTPLRYEQVGAELPNSFHNDLNLKHKRFQP